MIVSPKASFRVCACGLLVLCQAGMGQSGAESALDASDIDSGWDLLGDLREALPNVATNGAAEGRAPPIQALRLVSPACAFTPWQDTARRTVPLGRGPCARTAQCACHHAPHVAVMLPRLSSTLPAAGAWK